MGLELRKGASKWWYGRVVVNGRKLTKNLGVKVRGTPPSKLGELGDLPFERSRAEAHAAFESWQNEMKRRTTTEELIQTIHEIRTGARVGSIPLAEIGERWKSLPRRRPLSERYLDQALSWITRFVSFVQGAYPVVVDMHQVQAPMARAYFKQVADRGVAAKTYNSTLILLRSVFQALRKEAGIPENPFEDIPARDGEAIFRRPFSAEELRLIVDAAKADAFIYPLIVTGVCTAMRRGDCCTLLREAVDLKSGFITVKTSKTGETVQIPIFPLFREVLEKALAEPSPRPPHYVFPDLEAHYKINPDHLTDRVRRVIKAAGFFDPEDGATDGPASRGALQIARREGLRKASVRDFHSFRVTWVTLALTAGVPMELVRKVTGHRTAEIVMKHYFQPGREEFRRTLAGKLPALLGGGVVEKPIELAEVRELLLAMERRTWRKVRDDLLARMPARDQKVVEVAERPPVVPPKRRVKEAPPFVNDAIALQRATPLPVARPPSG